MIDYTYIAYFIFVLLISVTLHEMMHALIAHKLGDDLAHSHGRISLNPLQHIDPFLSIGLPALLLLLNQPPILAAKPVPINTSRIKGEEMGLAVVALAGPLTNLALAFIAGLVLNFVNLGGAALEIVGIFVVLNVSLFVFNMLPIPPLDGSRLLYAVAPAPLQSVMRQIESLGILGLVLILIVTLPFLGPILTTVSNFIIQFILF